MNGMFTPQPARAPVAAMLARHIRFELVLTARRGDALVLSLAVPIVGMLAVGLTDVVRLPTGDRLGYVAPGAVALAVMSTAFTGQAITVGYERFYGVLKRLGASALTRAGLLTGKACAIAVLALAQALLLALIAVVAGWRPHLAQVPAALGVTILAVAAYTGLALVLASRLRPETATATATLLYTLMLVFGGVLFPKPKAANAELLNPVAAHAETLRVTLTDGAAAPAWAWYSLALWAVCAVYAAARTFRWE